MDKVLVIASDAYRMVDALKDYADILDMDRDRFSLAGRTRAVADRIENGKRATGLFEVERFDFDAAHSAVVGVLCDRRERAEALRAKADELDAEATRAENLLARITV